MSDTDLFLDKFGGPFYCHCIVLSLAVFSLSSMAELVAEIATMKIFDHPNVLQLLGVCVDTNDDDMLRTVLPYMANGDLRNFLKQRRVDLANTSEFPTVCCFVISTFIH